MSSARYLNKLRSLPVLGVSPSDAPLPMRRRRCSPARMHLRWGASGDAPRRPSRESWQRCRIPAHVGGGGRHLARPEGTLGRGRPPGADGGVEAVIAIASPIYCRHGPPPSLPSPCRQTQAGCLADVPTQGTTRAHPRARQTCYDACPPHIHSAPPRAGTRPRPTHRIQREVASAAARQPPSSPSGSPAPPSLPYGLACTRSDTGHGPVGALLLRRQPPNHRG